MREPQCRRQSPSRVLLLDAADTQARERPPRLRKIIDEGSLATVELLQDLFDLGVFFLDIF